MINLTECNKFIGVGCNVIIIMNISLPWAHAIQIISAWVQVNCKFQISSFIWKSRSHIKRMILSIINVSLLQNNPERHIFVIKIMWQKTTIKLRNCDSGIWIGLWNFEVVARVEIWAVFWLDCCWIKWRVCFGIAYIRNIVFYLTRCYFEDSLFADVHFWSLDYCAPAASKLKSFWALFYYAQREVRIETKINNFLRRNCKHWPTESNSFIDNCWKIWIRSRFNKIFTVRLYGQGHR